MWCYDKKARTGSHFPGEEGSAMVRIERLLVELESSLG
jgi:hypothetical protein